MKNHSLLPNDSLYWLAATNLHGIGPITFHHWLTLFGNIKTLFSATPSDLTAAGLSTDQIHLLQNPDWHTAEKT